MTGLLVILLAQTWQQGMPMPTPGYGFACAAVGQRVFAIGGLVSETDTAVPRMQVEAYDVEADSWLVEFSPLPSPRWYAGCAALDGKIYVMGGTDGHSDLSRVDRFDPSTNTWDTVAPLPWRRSALTGCAHENLVYAIGGYSTALGTYRRSVAQFTPDSGVGRWKVADSLTYRRASPAAAVAGGRVCVVGGRYYANDYASFEFLLPSGWYLSSRWMHTARSGAAAVGWGKWLCVIGGQGRNGPLSSVEVVNMESSTEPWQNVEQLSAPRVFCGAAIVGSTVVVVGGRDDHGIRSEVEKADSTLFPTSGVEEPASVNRLDDARRWATVASGHVRISCGEADIYDGSGRRVFAGPGPVDIRLTPGVYFARVSRGGHTVTGTITVVR